LGFGFGPHPPIPNPQSPIPNPQYKKINLYFIAFFKNIKLLILKK